MKNNKSLAIVLLSVSCFLFVVAITLLLLNSNHFSFRNKIEKEETSKNQTEENLKDTTENSNNNQENPSNNQIPDNSDNIMENTTNNNENLENNLGNSIVENNTQTVLEEKNESAIIAYFESSSNLLSENSNQEDRSLREKAKDSFTTVVDFIFYDKEIKGYTFKELTNAAKLKVIKLALTIDHKIDSYFPDYKETIKDKYTDIKGKLAVKYLEFTSSLCDSVGEDTCNQAKEDFNTMKESFGFTWQLIKELAKSGSNKIKDFYESWRDSE